MGEFYDCGQHYPPCDDRRTYLLLSREDALMFDREAEQFESWMDGRCIARDRDQTPVTNAKNDYREIRSRQGITQAQDRYPDLS